MNRGNFKPGWTDYSFAADGAAHASAIVGGAICPWAGGIRYLVVVQNNPSARNEHPLRELTEQDLLLGKRASRIIDILCLVGFIACAGIAIYVFMSVPLDARMSYSGQFGRNGIPVPVAMLVVVLVLVLFWRGGKKPDAHHMGKGGRILLYILGPAIVVGCVAGQLVMAQSILAGAVLPS